MRSVEFIVPGSIATRTGGYEYDRQIIAGLRARGWAVDVHELDGTFPYPTAASLDGAARTLAACPDGALVVIDGLALGAMPEQIEREAARLRIVGLVHLPLAAEIGIGRQEASRLHASERRALAGVRRVIVTGPSTVSALAGYSIDADRIDLVEPGTARMPLARGSEGGKTIHMITVATLSPGKGHALLFDALARIRTRNWRLACAGSTSRYPDTVHLLRAQLHALRLEERVTLAGELDESGLARLYDEADLFVLATLRETYGMAVAEALARGLPVVATATGAIPRLVGDDAGVVVPPGDATSLAEAVERFVEDPAFRTRCAEGAKRARERLRTWDAAVDEMVAALDRAMTA
jgi:glycosyltransferase involved in cell wall biosynthesis